MKKFLSKKPVMITFIVLAVVMIAFYIGMMVRPVSYGMNYVSKSSLAGVESTTKYKANSDKTMRLTSITEKNDKIDLKAVVDFWIYRDGDTIYLIGEKKYISGIEDGKKASKDDIKEANEHVMSKDDYKKVVESLDKAKEEGEIAFAAALTLNGVDVALYDIGIYEAKTFGGSEAKCSGAIVFTVVGAVVVVALVTVASLSVVFTVKGKKRK